MRYVYGLTIALALALEKKKNGARSRLWLLCQQHLGPAGVMYLLMSLRRPAC